MNSRAAKNLAMSGGKSIARLITRPFSKKTQLYSTPEYDQQMKDKKNPKSSSYKKNFVDKMADRVLSR